MEQCKKINFIFLVINVAYQIRQVTGDDCKPLWDNSCTADSVCCSNYCFKESHWAYGVCKPREPSADCKPLWDNTCTGNIDCCTNYCFKESHWAYGVCKPIIEPTVIAPSAPIICKPLWDNTCLDHKECCSQFCHQVLESDVHSAYGICKPVVQSPLLIEDE